MTHLLALSPLPFVHQQIFYTSTTGHLKAMSITANMFQHRPFLLLLTQVVTVSPLLPLSCTCSLHIKDRWEWTLISHVRQPTLATLQTYNDSCWAQIQRDLSVQLIVWTNCWKAGEEKSKSVYQCLSSRLCPCLSPLFHESNESMGEKRNREWEKEREGRVAEKEEIGFSNLVLLLLLLSVSPSSSRCGSSPVSLCMSACHNQFYSEAMCCPFLSSFCPSHASL